MKLSVVVIGLLGTTLDQGRSQERWNKWRPTISLFQHEDLLISRFELLYEKKFRELAELVIQDIKSVSPETKIQMHEIEVKDTWDFENVYSILFDFARNYPFDIEKEEYLVHITTGSHVAQICTFLLTESRYFPAKLIQTSPPRRNNEGVKGDFRIIDLDLSRYDKIAQRFRKEHKESLSFLKSGIETKNQKFNKLIEQIERVAINSTSPFLLMGPTGAGKSLLARRIYELKKSRSQIKGNFIEVNCATLRGEMSMSTLFGHVKGAFTGAGKDRSGLLREANEGILFLDEIGELGQDEQAMLLKALEGKRFLPVGADHEVESKFQLIAGTNRDLGLEVNKGTFREDLYSRINLWTFHLPALKDRAEDIEVNIEYELEKFAQTNSVHITFNKEAKEAFLKFAKSEKAIWKANFRDLNASITRMATLASGGRINLSIVEEEIKRLIYFWENSNKNNEEELQNLLTEDQLNELDLIEKVQLKEAIKVCRQSKSLSEAGRILYSSSRKLKSTSNDADRLRKFLARYKLSWDLVAKTMIYGQ
jgi:transcriptional regulatory protein RtcR